MDPDIRSGMRHRCGNCYIGQAGSELADIPSRKARCAAGGNNEDAYNDWKRFFVNFMAHKT